MSYIQVGPQYHDIDDDFEYYLSQQGLEQFKEFRKDGWPLCPNCGEDELWCPSLVSFYNVNGRNPIVDECIELGLRCYRCQAEFPSKDECTCGTGTGTIGSEEHAEGCPMREG
jgi:hypothetical protein